LSERFNEKEKDIRFSRTTEAPYTPPTDFSEAFAEQMQAKYANVNKPVVEQVAEPIAKSKFEPVPKKQTYDEFIAELRRQEAMQAPSTPPLSVVAEKTIKDGQVPMSLSQRYIDLGAINGENYGSLQMYSPQSHSETTQKVKDAIKEYGANKALEMALTHDSKLIPEVQIGIIMDAMFWLRKQKAKLTDKAQIDIYDDKIDELHVNASILANQYGRAIEYTKLLETAVTDGRSAGRFIDKANRTSIEKAKDKHKVAIKVVEEMIAEDTVADEPSPARKKMLALRDKLLAMKRIAPAPTITEPKPLGRRPLFSKITDEDALLAKEVNDLIASSNQEERDALLKEYNDIQSEMAKEPKPKRKRKVKTKEEFTDEAMERIKKQFRNRKIVDAKGLKRAILAIGEKHRAGTIKASDVERIFMEKFEISQIDQATKAELMKQADDMSKFNPDSTEYKNMQAELYQNVTEAMNKGFSTDDIAVNLFYQFMLSRISTQLTNTISTGIVSGAETALAVISPKDYGFRTIQNIQSLWKLNESGFAKGASEAIHHLKTGKNIIREADKKFEKPNMGALLFKDKYKIFNNIMYVTRTMMASDTFWFKPIESMKARLIAVEMANDALDKGKITPAKFWDYANELIYATDTQLASAKTRAENEYKTAKHIILKKRDRLTGKPTGENYEGKEADEVYKKWVARRAWEINENERNKQLGGEFGERVKQAGLVATLNQEPDGVIGVIGGMIGSGTSGQISDDMDATTKYSLVGLKLAGKSVMPFTRVLANIMNMTLDYSGRGFITLPVTKTWQYQKGLGVVTVDLSIDTRIDRMKRSIAGFAMATALYALCIAGKKDDGSDDWEEGFEIYGSMADDIEGRKKLASMGAYPYSVRFGKIIIPFTQLVPLVPALTVIGGIRDRQRTGKWQEMDWTSTAVMPLAELARVATSVSFLKNANNFLDIFNGSTKQMGDKFSTWATRAITAPVPGLAKEIDGWFMSSKIERKTVLDKLLGQFPVFSWFGKPTLNYFGDEISMPYLMRPLKSYATIAGYSLDYFILASEKDMTLGKAGKVEINGQKLSGADEYEYGKKSGQYTKQIIDAVGFDTIRSLKDDKWSKKNAELLVDENGNIIPSPKTTNRADLLMHQMLQLARRQAQYDMGEKLATKSELRMRPEEFDKFMVEYAKNFKANLPKFEAELDKYSKKGKPLDPELEKERYKDMLSSVKQATMNDLWKRKTSDERKAYRTWLKEVDEQAKIPRKK